MEEKIIAQLNKFFLNPETSTTTILYSAIQLAEIMNNEKFQQLFKNHLTGITSKQAETLSGTEVLKMFSTDRMRPGDNFYLTGSLSVIEGEIQNKNKDIERYVQQSEDLSHSNPAHKNIHHTSFSPYLIQQRAFTKMISDLRTQKSQLEEIIFRIRTRVMLFVRAAEKRIKRKIELKIYGKKVLKYLFEVYLNQNEYISKTDLVKNVEMNVSELDEVLEYLKISNLIKEEKNGVLISLIGINEIETMNKMEQETPEQRRYRVLKTIYDISEGNPSELVLYDNIENSTSIDSSKMTGILQYLEQRNLIKMGGEWLQITSNGIDQIETTRNHPEEATPYFPANIYNNTFNAQVTGIQQGGQNNTQNISITNNTEFDKIIATLLELIHSSSMPNDVKEECLTEIQAINKLAIKEPTNQTLERVKLRISLLETALKTTDIAIKVAPYFPQIIAFFEGIVK